MTGRVGQVGRVGLVGVLAFTVVSGLGRTFAQAKPEMMRVLIRCVLGIGGKRSEQ